MFTLNQYDNFMTLVSNRVYNLRNYASYICFENAWLNYLNNIFLPFSNQNLPPRIFIAESAPNGIYRNNKNYIFHLNTLNNNVNEKSDMYLYRYYRGVFPNFTPDQTRLISKHQALIDLAAQNILILDLLPTHGIKLKENDRTTINTHLMNLVNFNFLNSLNFPNYQINYATRFTNWIANIKIFRLNFKKLFFLNSYIVK